ncbi:hypothetical protein BJ165DRAFT_1530113 [Panaeolus papilionaceus]|nr:hypothetical protein BJ165DRAFT_1530113 [Panaeolus papilionaceus]
MSSALPTDKLPSTQEEVLHNADLVLAIFGFMTVNGLMKHEDALPIRKSLYAAAMTCKAFKEPALDMLWSVIPSLVPLFRLLPSFMTYENIYMLHYMEDKDWKVFDSYAKRVREIAFQTYPSSSPLNLPVSPHVLIQLFCLRQDSSTTFPGLKTIRIPSDVKVDENYILMLPTRHMETIEFNDERYYSRQLLPSLFTFLSQKTPYLRHLTLRGQYPVTIDPISQFSRLISLELLLPMTYVNTPFLKRIGSMEHLKNLSLHVGTTSAAPSASSGRHTSYGIGFVKGPQFSALRCLELRGHPSLISRTLDHVQPPTLESITIYEEQLSGDSTQTIPSWHLIFSNLSCSRYLTSVKVVQSANRSWGHAGYSLSSDALIALAGIPASGELKSLIVEGGAISITDTFIQEFSSAFSALTLLEFPCSTFNSAPTIRALLGIAQNCRELKTLQLPLRCGTKIDEDLAFMREHRQQLMESPDTSNPRHPLQKLFIDDSLLSGLKEPVCLAQFLNNWFPKLKTMLLPTGANAEWGLVEKIMLALSEKENEVGLRWKLGSAGRLT